MKALKCRFYRKPLTTASAGSSEEVSIGVSFLSSPTHKELASNSKFPSNGNLDEISNYPVNQRLPFKRPFFLLELVIAFFLFSLTVSSIFAWQANLKQKEILLLKGYALEYALEDAKFFLPTFLDEKKVKLAISKKDTPIFLKEDEIQTPFFENAKVKRSFQLKHTYEPKKKNGKYAYLLTATIKVELLGQSKEQKIRTISFQEKMPLAKID